MKFYRIIGDSDEAAWFLGEPVDHRGDEVDARLFTEGKLYDAKAIPVRVPKMRQGTAKSFTLAAFDMPVVDSRVVEAILAVGSEEEVQLIPVEAEGEGRDHFIANVLRAEDCFSTTDSWFDCWEPGDGRPEKTGQIKTVGRLRIDPDRVDRAHIFRVRSWLVALIVSQSLKEALEAAGVSGVVFEAVA